MTRLFSYVANILGIAGMGLGLLAGIGRLTGAYTMFGFQSVSIFVAGVALIVTGCFFKLQQLAGLLEDRKG